MFYRDHFGSRPPTPKANDVQYSFFDAGKVIATLRISPKQQDWIFLRGVCVATPQRNQGLALKLMKETWQHHPTSGVYCFADPKLAPLYVKAGFQHWNPTTLSTTATNASMPPKFITIQYDSMRQRLQRKHKELALFTKSPLDVHVSSSTSHDQHSVTQVVLLQHEQERKRKTATAPLLTRVNEHVIQEASPIQSVNVTIWLWGGRVDNSKIESLLEEISNPVLLWTGGKNIKQYHVDSKNNDTTTNLYCLGWNVARSQENVSKNTQASHIASRHSPF